MRITNPTILRGYNRSLNRLLNLKTQCEGKITSGRKFSRASEAPLSAAKALNVRKSLYYSAQYKENLKVAEKFYTEAETSLLQVSEKMAEIRETIIAACNTTKDIQDRNIYAQQLETSALELCAIFNTDTAGRAIFGGESNDGMPFEIIKDSSGNPSTVLYHGVPVNSMSDPTQFPYSKEVYSDVGLGMDMDQLTQKVDPQSVLRISFNGAKITGCGAEGGVADVDLSSIKQNRLYCIDVYAGNIKKTITFTGQDTYANNVAEINNKLLEAYDKEIRHGKDFPEMDAQGVISLKHREVAEDGTVTISSVDNGICCVVNNEIKNNRAEKLVVDNDSGYTDKFKVNLNALSEGEDYAIDVTVGGVTKTITFTAGTDNFDDPDNPVYREEYSLENIQAALDAAFGYDDQGNSLVNISTSDATRGVISSEGSAVKVIAHDPVAEIQHNEVTISSTSTSRINFDLLNHDGTTQYAFNATVNGTMQTVTFTAGANEAATAGNISAALGAAFPGTTFSIANSGDSKGVISANGTPVSITRANDNPPAVSVAPSSYTSYSIDASALVDGEKYSLKIINGTNVKNIEFTAGADTAANAAAIQGELDAAFGAGRIIMTTNGDNLEFSSANGRGVSVAVPSGEDIGTPVVERQQIFSNNYIQLTLDAARALRSGDIAYANACIDRIVTANENLLVEIADLGCNEEFISFNLERLTIREENLQERQTDLEATDAKQEITLWKTYEAMYNACLQMSSSVVPNSIFNYIK